MSVEILSGVVSETIYVDPGDLVFVPEGEVLVWEGDVDGIAILNDYDSPVEGPMHAVVAGQISTDYFAIAMGRTSEDVVAITVTDTGNISAEYCVYLTGISTNILHNFGRLTGEARAIYVSGSSGDQIVNHGEIYGEQGVSFTYSDDLFMANYGAIYASTGIHAGAVCDLTIVNAGVIEAQPDLLEDTYGIYCTQGDTYVLENLGEISAKTAVRFSDVTKVEIVNSGVITAADTGVELVMAEAVLTNLGTISGPQAISAHSASELTLQNEGTINGTVNCFDYGTGPQTGSQDQILNIGTIDGDVILGHGRDHYAAAGVGHVTGVVDGGIDNDTLIGARLSDRFEGGTGDDTLRGRLGADELSGGTGADLLHGGRDADVLTGGAGADLFVFGATAGADVITDFELGTDVIRLHRQAGGMEALAFEDLGADLVLTHAGGSITLSGLAGQVLTVDDIAFA